MILVIWTCGVLAAAALLTTVRWFRGRNLFPLTQGYWHTWEWSLWGAGIGALLFFLLLYPHMM